jgi:hypothetical protein
MTEERVKSKDVQELMHRLRPVAPPDGSLERRPKEKITVYLKNGQSYSAEVTHARRISGRAELEAKFFGCVQGSLSSEMAAQTRDIILNLEKLADVAKLADLVRGE